MKLYKLKHKPTGLFYQPHRFGGSHLSKNGKIYQKEIPCMTNIFSNNITTTIILKIDSTVHKIARDKIFFKKCVYTRNSCMFESKKKEWEIYLLN